MLAHGRHSRMRRVPPIVLTVVMATSVVSADGVHGDVWLRVAGDQLVTGLVDEDGTPVESAWRVFAGEFGEDPRFPFFADHPGFRLFGGSVAPGSPFTINIAGPVERWTGAGFGATPSLMTIAYGPGSVTSGGGYVSGFQWHADARGGFHGHFDLEIHQDGGDPEDGIYLLPLSISSDIATATPVFWFVMNLGADERDHEQAIDWVITRLVPGPGALPLCVLMACAGVRSRRRR